MHQYSACQSKPRRFQSGKWHHRRPHFLQRDSNRMSIVVIYCFHPSRSLTHTSLGLIPPSAVLWKLILFSLLMAIVPIGTYFGTLNYMWYGGWMYRLVLP